MQSFAQNTIFCALNRGRMKKNIAVFASGSGTNAENIIDYFSDNDSVRVAVVVTNNASAGVVERAKRLQVPILYFPKADWSIGYSIVDTLRSSHIDFVVLAGFLLRIPDSVLAAYPDKIINIHPSLLPKYGGKGMYGSKVHEAVVAAGDRESGITIHYINEHYDEGAIILQKKCSVLSADTPDDVAAKVHALEYEYYPKIIEQVIKQAL